MAPHPFPPWLLLDHDTAEKQGVGGLADPGADGLPSASAHPPAINDPHEEQQDR